jgi:hypothetical protein
MVVGGKVSSNKQPNVTPVDGLTASLALVSTSCSDMSLVLKLKQFTIAKSKGEKIAKVEFRGKNTLNYLFSIFFSFFSKLITMIVGNIFFFLICNSQVPMLNITHGTYSIRVKSKT